MFIAGHERLKNPKETQPSDIHAGLHPVPGPDPTSAIGLEPYEVVCLGDDESTETVYIGVEDGFVNREDFMEWKKAVKKWLTEKYAENKLIPLLDSTLLEWGVGLVWPDQSYVSIRRLKEVKDLGWTCQFHEARFQMLVG